MSPRATQASSLALPRDASTARLFNSLRVTSCTFRVLSVLKNEIASGRDTHSSACHITAGNAGKFVGTRFLGTLSHQTSTSHITARDTGELVGTTDGGVDRPLVQLVTRNKL